MYFYFDATTSEWIILFSIYFVEPPLSVVQLYLNLKIVSDICFNKKNSIYLSFQFISDLPIEVKQDRTAAW